jgi:phosphoribosyl-AMP cyclohydrolase
MTVTLDHQTIMDSINWDSRGLIPVITQNYRNGRVLMLAWMNRDALAQTLKDKQAVYWSRSRKRLWKKGEESGCLQHIKNVYVDCDNDTLLLWVEQQGAGACHTGTPSCFFRRLEEKQWRDAETPAYHHQDIQCKQTT